MSKLEPYMKVSKKDSGGITDIRMEPFSVLF